jgi:hypothetical protein
MREAEEEDARERGKLASKAAPQITSMSDEELAAELRRRTEAKHS